MMELYNGTPEGIPTIEEQKYETPEGAESSESPENPPECKEVDTVCDLLNNGRNVYLTGAGGTGKSHILRQVYSRMIGSGRSIYKTGSTGTAADNIQGMTLHSWAGVQLADKEAVHYFIRLRSQGGKALKRWTNAEILIIDEFSMTGGRLLTLLDALGKMIRRNRKPFGGIRVLASGDFFQLPPINDVYAFMVPVYKEINFENIILTYPWRYQKDIEYFHLLSRARFGELNANDIKALTERMTIYYRDIVKKEYSEGEIKPTRLLSKRVDVHAINMAELEKLPHDEVQYVASDAIVSRDSKKNHIGDILPYQELIEKTVRNVVSIKKGAQVMLTWNLDLENGLCNGSRGVVLECTDSGVQVRFRNCEILVTPHAWTIENDEVIFTRTQIPLILAYAITIHKSQSATLDSVIIDLGTSIFSDNMAYVALSRCRCLDGIYLNNFMPSKVKCDPQAKAFELSILSQQRLDKDQ